MPNPTPWDDTSLEILKRLHAEGYSAGLISKELISKGHNFSRNAVIGKKSRLGLPPPDDELPHVKITLAANKKLKAERKVQQGKISSPKFVWHRRPQSLGAQAAVEVPHMVASNDTESKAILLTKSEDGQCRAIVGYENGELGKAIVCGKPTPFKVRRGRLIRISWCQNHYELYTQEDRIR